MPLALLIDLVHRNGGVLGPAHPCGEKYMSFTHARKFYQSPEIIKRFDFVEGFNSCETTESNAGAMKLAKKYGKLTTGGSDSHKSECVGRGYTILPEPVSCETELISLIHKKTPLKTGGVLYNKTTKEKIGKINKWKRSIHLIRSTRSNYIIIRNTFRMERNKRVRKTGNTEAASV